MADTQQKKFAIVCDSACDVPLHALNSAHVRLVPYYVCSKEQNYRECIDLDPLDFYVRLSATKGRFTIKSPTTKDYARVFEECRDLGYKDIVTLHASTKLFDSYSACVTAAKSILGVCVHAIDTKCISAQLALVLAALVRDRNNGLDVEEACERAVAVANATKISIILPPQAADLTRVSSKPYGSILLGAQALKARAFGVRRMFTLTDEGLPKELCSAPELHVLTGRLVRNMSLYGHKVGPLTHVEINAGAPRLLATLEKPLDTNEFESHVAGIVNTSPCITKLLGIGTVGVSYTPSAYVSAAEFSSFLAGDE